MFEMDIKTVMVPEKGSYSYEKEVEFVQFISTIEGIFVIVIENFQFDKYKLEETSLPVPKGIKTCGSCKSTCQIIKDKNDNIMAINCESCGNYGHASSDFSYMCRGEYGSSDCRCKQ